MITIDGSSGEGGGQIVRSSLALSLVTGEAVTIENIRARRRRPGLARQHLTAVRAAAEVGRACVVGDELDSQRLVFEPGEVRGDEYWFRIGTAGSTTLVLQTVLPALLLAPQPSTLTLDGGTHNMLAPPFDFLANSYLPLVERMGPQITAQLDQYGFFPAGGGRFRVAIKPVERLGSLQLVERGDVRRIRVRAILSRLQRHIAQRECQTIGEKTGWPEECFFIEEVDSLGPGNIVLIEIECDHVAETFAGFGEKGVRAETVARRALDEAERYLAANVPVGQHLADQMLLPLGLSAHFGAGGVFKTLPLTDHSATHIDLLRQFLNITIDVEETGAEQRLVRVAPA